MNDIMEKNVVQSKVEAMSCLTQAFLLEFIIFPEELFTPQMQTTTETLCVHMESWGHFVSTLDQL